MSVVSVLLNPTAAIKRLQQAQGQPVAKATTKVPTSAAESTEFDWRDVPILIVHEWRHLHSNQFNGAHQLGVVHLRVVHLKSYS
jgi:hypothetical protein